MQKIFLKTCFSTALLLALSFSAVAEEKSYNKNQMEDGIYEMAGLRRSTSGQESVSEMQQQAEASPNWSEVIFGKNTSDKNYYVGAAMSFNVSMVDDGFKNASTDPNKAWEIISASEKAVGGDVKTSNKTLKINAGVFLGNHFRVDFSFNQYKDFYMQGDFSWVDTLNNMIMTLSGGYIDSQFYVASVYVDITKRSNFINPFVVLGLGYYSNKLGDTYLYDNGANIAKIGQENKHIIYGKKESGIGYRVGGGLAMNLLLNATLEASFIYNNMGKVKSANRVHDSWWFDTGSNGYIETDLTTTPIESKFNFWEATVGLRINF